MISTIKNYLGFLIGLLGVLMLIPAMAKPADLECLDSSLYYNPDNPLKAMPTINFCTPFKDMAGNELPEGHIEQCMMLAYMEGDTFEPGNTRDGRMTMGNWAGPLNPGGLLTKTITEPERAKAEAENRDLIFICVTPEGIGSVRVAVDWSIPPPPVGVPDMPKVLCTNLLVTSSPGGGVEASCVE